MVAFDVYKVELEPLKIDRLGRHCLDVLGGGRGVITVIIDFHSVHADTVMKNELDIIVSFSRGHKQSQNINII